MNAERLQNGIIAANGAARSCLAERVEVLIIFAAEQASTEHKARVFRVT